MRCLEPYHKEVLMYWDDFKNNLRDAFRFIFASLSMSEAFTYGLIYLIPKGDGPLEDILKS